MSRYYSVGVTARHPMQVKRLLYGGHAKVLNATDYMNVIGCCVRDVFSRTPSVLQESGLDTGSQMGDDMMMRTRYRDNE